jgi:hypothetical protein
VSVNLDKLSHGDVLCYSESNPAFPESWHQREQKMLMMVDSSTQNPGLAQWLFSPANLPILADAIRMRDFKIPGAASVTKQKGEFELLLRAEPQPNPQVVQMQQVLEESQVGMQQAQASGQPVPPEAAGMIQQVQQQMKSLPPLVSTVPVAQDESEMHAIEADTCFQWMNSSDGQKFKNGTPQQKAAFENVHLHWKEHVDMAKKIAAANAPPEKPPSESISASLKDMPTAVAIQALAKLGIHASPEDFAQKQKDDLQHKVAARAIPQALQGQ